MSNLKFFLRKKAVDVWFMLPPEDKTDKQKEKPESRRLTG